MNNSLAYRNCHNKNLASRNKYRTVLIKIEFLYRELLKDDFYQKRLSVENEPQGFGSVITRFFSYAENDVIVATRKSSAISTQMLQISNILLYSVDHFDCTAPCVCNEG